MLGEIYSLAPRALAALEEATGAMLRAAKSATSFGQDLAGVSLDAPGLGSGVLGHRSRRTWASTPGRCPGHRGLPVSAPPPKTTRRTSRQSLNFRTYPRDLADHLALAPGLTSGDRGRRPGCDDGAGGRASAPVVASSAAPAAMVALMEGSGQPAWSTCCRRAQYAVGIHLEEFHTPSPPPGVAVSARAELRKWTALDSFSASGKARSARRSSGGQHILQRRQSNLRSAAAASGGQLAAKA